MEMPMPENEAERVKALHRYKILDTSPEKVYDNLTRLAAYICQTPVAVISFVDSHRLWFKSKTGIDLPITEIPRNVGCFCTHAIMLPDLFAVPNALDDERFVKSDLVASPLQVRFYAGAPLITPDGLSLGTLCVIDQKP
ncbi:MAG TPA: GAF domain-containing protein, partial [Candidatus Manganitrophaceae bacterium]|nr:GAF domain-containing protein [Candidatus Manganitrophaceae bacterium]